MENEKDLDANIVKELTEIKVKLDLISQEHPQCKGQLSEVKEQVHLLRERVARAEQDIK